MKFITNKDFIHRYQLEYVRLQLWRNSDRYIDQITLTSHRIQNEFLSDCTKEFHAMHVCVAVPICWACIFLYVSYDQNKKNLLNIPSSNGGREFFGIWSCVTFPKHCYWYKCLLTFNTGVSSTKVITWFKMLVTVPVTRLLVFKARILG